MANVVDYEEFSALRDEVRREREENRLYREIVGNLVWLTRAQAAEVLRVSDSTMHRLIKRKDIGYRAEGSRQLFSIPDLVTYLTGQKIALSAIRQRLNSLPTQQKTDTANATPVSFLV